MFSGRLGVLLTALAALGAATPAPLDVRSVSTSTLDELQLFAQWSAAAYCSNNIDSDDSNLTCTANACPSVEEASTKMLLEFDLTNDFGGTAGFLAADNTNKRLVVAFRGSSTIENWVADLDFILEDNDDLCTGCKVHTGFWKAWESAADDLTSNIKSAMSTYSGYTLYFTGHSLGGALATLGATVLRNDGYSVELYTYGCPRIGNYALAEHITSQGSGANFRVTHLNDIVPRLPPMDFGFSQPSPEYWITSGTGASVTASDIEVIEGINSTAGNAGEATLSHPRVSTTIASGASVVLLYYSIRRPTFHPHPAPPQILPESVNSFEPPPASTSPTPTVCDRPFRAAMFPAPSR
ncbi:triacylglycerol lipase A [Aspergillus eucalypticola CBS 122712]|uniref:feruloyl esterase n=1 Tax=Aspergillus eucalypticola (strain CBS 122712 / IBT 29274) TaxID=1448314 RepID=A0A317VEC9_ASPEC|nr:triacylglycerol lipase A [Aspergillus eucalypticola CBS 122712]PWY72723.1 triacylglycerol lipase A [Aspergillus eucalypticola CBS 122712]